MNKKGIIKSSFILLNLVLLLVFSTNIFAQGSSSVSGTVTDSQGNAVAGANVTLISEQNTKRNTVTSSEGNYTFPQIQPGTYKLEVEAKGFKKASVTSFRALVDNPSKVDVRLEVGIQTEVVEVTSGGIDGIKNDQNASLGNNFVAAQIEQLPLEGRNVANLLSLQAAVTPDGSVAGGRSDQANITLDGIDVNDQQNGTAFEPVLRVTPDSIEEFRVTTSNADASQGRSSGAQISLITRSGGNAFRGALYEYHRNTATTANDYFNNISGVARPKLIRNLFGGRISGPIKKDRLFFFYNYEGLREAKQTSVVNTVPLASLGAGNVRFFDNAGVLTTLTLAEINGLVSGGNPVVDVNNAARLVLASAASRYASNDTTVGDGLNTGGFRFNASLPVKLNTHTARIDWKITGDEKHSLQFRGNYQSDLFAGVPAFPDTPQADTWSHPIGFLAGYTWVINNNLVNNFKFGLTRDAFSNQGDSTDNAITFRDVFSPSNFARTFSRVTPVYNITDDVSWIKGNHTFQFGGNIRIIRNKRESFGQAFDNGVTNFTFYSGSGSVVTSPVNAYLSTLTPGRQIGAAWTRPVGTALTALFGRLSQYGANFNFDLQGAPLTAGTGIVREFATEEYDLYVQDVWKARSNLTLTLGLRYGLSMPVYETQGYQAKPNISLQEYFERRIQAAAAGRNYTDPLLVVKAGPANNADGYYSLDKDNLQPRISVAWSPNFKDGFLSKIFGTEQGDSVLRGGFAITNDYFGQALAVNFDGNNRLGFSSNQTISANTYNVTTNPAPLYTGPGMAIRTLPGITIPGTLTFPQQQPSNQSRRIEGSLDSNLVSPINYSWNVTFGRKLPQGLYVEASYVGRLARNLLAARDVMTPNNIKDPISGQTWYEAANILEQYRVNRTPVSQIPNLPFFENMYAAGSIDAVLFGAGLSNTRAAYGFMATTADTPGCAGSPLFGCYDSGTDWTFLQDVLDRFVTRPGGPLFYQPQYGALSAYGTIGKSDYHGGSLSVRQRLKGLTWDLNYTFSKSIDDASGLQTSGVYGSALILNPLRQSDNRAVSDFDLRHIINVNGIWDLPFGKGKKYFSNMNGVLDAIFGGWQMSGIYRWNTGYPAGDWFDVAGWPTNWNVRSNIVRIKPIQSSPNATSGSGGVPNLFSDRTAAYRSFRSPAPGETGDRNQLRLPNYIVLDMGLQKSFNMPWKEGHVVKFRFDVFNVTNTARFTGIADASFGLDPQRGGTPAPSWGNFTAQQGSPRVMQFALRYEF
jgi:hypothetical protein